jgi:CubicO group peptidase (beta-lactamase class C family)
VGTARAEPTSWIPDSLRPGGELDTLVAKLAVEGRFSGTVLLTHRKKPVLARSHGMADKVRRISNGPDTVFAERSIQHSNLGSITKTFTGVAIASLAEQNRVAYGATLGTYLDGFAPEIAMSRQDNNRFLGYSMWADRTNGQWINGHNGGSPGVSCNLDWFPESGWVAVVLSNYDSATDRGGPAATISSKARELITG